MGKKGRGSLRQSGVVSGGILRERTSYVEYEAASERLADGMRRASLWLGTVVGAVCEDRNRGAAS